ncbi:MAG: chorismate mutase, partial [Sulfobacillus sp.]|nr:chorismate mutase [Sulfobacillus sp.]
IGWKYVPVICARELDVPHGLPKTVRVLMHAESNRSPKEIRHVYLEGAVVLREDLVAEEPQRG